MDRDKLFQEIYEDDKKARRLKKTNKLTVIAVYVVLGVLIASLVGNVC